jgi:hypothetical protein
MPKRSNDFQRLVKVIYDAMSGVDGVMVTESAMLSEPDGTRREIDILLERTVADVLVRLAVECRDRSRKSDVDWIDGLIGKFKNLKIEKVIAVCRRGFSSAAIAKAHANNIEIRVLEECLAHNWSNEFVRLGFAAFEFVPSVRSVEFTLEPPPTEEIKPDMLVEMPGAVGTTQPLVALVNACLVENVIPRVKAYVEHEFLSKLPPLAELTRTWVFMVPVEIRDVWINTASGSRHKVISMHFEIAGDSHATVSSVQHFQYGRSALASVGSLSFGIGSHKMRVVQVAGQKRLTASITKLEPAKK